MFIQNICLVHAKSYTEVHVILKSFFVSIVAAEYLGQQAATGFCDDRTKLFNFAESNKCCK